MGCVGNSRAVWDREKKSPIFKRVETTPATPATPALQPLFKRTLPTQTDTVDIGAWNTKMNDDYETRAALPVARFSQHRPAPIELSTDSRLASATVLAYINGDDAIERAGAIEAVTARAASLAIADSDEALESLAEHLPVLNALFLRFSAEAIATKTPENRAKLLKIALGAQNSYGRTLALIAGLRAQRQGRARVILTDATGDDS